MGKLIRLEFRKTRLLGLLLGAIAAIGLNALWMAGSDIPNNGYPSYEAAFLAADNYVMMTFVVFSAVLLARMVIDEYRGRTISVLFTYPVRRAHWFVAKLIIVTALTFLTLLTANACVIGIVLLVNAYTHDLPGILTDEVLARHAVRMLLHAAAGAGISLIPLYFGMLRKTMPATIVTAFIMSNVLMTQMNRLSGSLTDTAWLAACCWGAGLLAAWLSIRKVDTADLT